MLGITSVASPPSDEEQGDVEAEATATACDVREDDVDVDEERLDDFRTTSNLRIVHLSVCWY